MIKKISTLFLFLIIPFVSIASLEKKEVTEELLKEIYAYLIPDNLEIKHQLDKMFKANRAILNPKALIKAGFTKAKPRKFTRIIVTTHKHFPGYIFKIYLDAQRYKSDEPEQIVFLNRVKGALAITKFIADNNLQDFFKVPKKWIYLVPGKPIPSKDFQYKNFILVEEDMHLLDKEANALAWKSYKVTKELLVGLYQILKEIGLRDCAKIDNIPFSEDGKVAFIDTQSYGYKSVPFKRLKKALSSEMQEFWDSLIH
jgi:hypothetical protein